MPFVIPASTRGKSKPQKPLIDIILSRFGDVVAGRGLENFRIEHDLRQEAEEQLNNFAPASREVAETSQTTIVRISSEQQNDDNQNNNNDTNNICCLPPPSDYEGAEERIVINKYGAHFVYIPTLNRYIARADRKTVRMSTISGRLCYVLQCCIILVGLYALLVRSVDCLGPQHDYNHNALPITTTLVNDKSEGSFSTVTSSSTTSVSSTNNNNNNRPLRTVYPGWEELTQHSSGLYVFVFFVLMIGGSIFQFFMLHSGDRSLGNPGYLSIEGDDQVMFELRGEYQNCSVDCSLPHELRKSCKTCGIPQPIRTRHCKSCGRCCPREDHHCFWLGHCVGSHDYGSFVLLIFVMALMATFGLDFLLGTWINVWGDNCAPNHQPDAGYLARQWHANGFTFFYILLVAIATLGLWLLVATHIALSITEMTTYEFARPGKNPHLRYFPAVPSLSGTTWAKLQQAHSSARSRFSLSSPFSETWYRNLYNLWWVYGSRSLYIKFGVGSRSHISALPAVRCGSIDGVNYFVSSGGATNNSTNNNNHNNSTSSNKKDEDQV